MLLSIYVLFRSVTRTLLVFVAILTSVLWTMGLYTLLGFSYNVLSSILPALIVVLAVADDVHIVQHFDHEYRLSGDYQQAFTSSVAAPLRAASWRQRDHGARHALPGDLGHRGRPRVRHRRRPSASWSTSCCRSCTCRR